MTLADRHRAAQVRIGATTVLQMRAIWRLLNPEDLDRTFADWAVAASGIIATQRALSARTAANYLAASKAAVLGLSLPLRPVLAESIDPYAVTTSLLVTGPVSIKRAMTRGSTVAQAFRTAEHASSATAMRHSLDGGRQTIIDTVQSDPDATGWQRVASGNACKFCASLDGKRHRKDDADFPAHDGCSCSQEPIWGNATQRPRRVEPAAPPTADAPVTPKRRLNASDLTQTQGDQIAASATRVASGEITAAEHRAFVRRLTGTDSRGRRR